MKKQNIEDIFSSMENFSSAPPPELWANIEKKLDKPKKKKRAILWWSAAACLLLGLMLPAVLHFNSNSGIKTLDNRSVKNNNVVLDEKKTESNNSETITNNEINIKMIDLPVGKYQYHLYNALGQLMTSGNINHAQRFSIHNIKPLNILAKGMYKLEIVDEKNKAIFIKVVVQHN